MELTIEKLRELNACSESIEWFEAQSQRNHGVNIRDLIGG